MVYEAEYGYDRAYRLRLPDQTEMDCTITTVRDSEESTVRRITYTQSIAADDPAATVWLCRLVEETFAIFEPGYAEAQMVLGYEYADVMAGCRECETAADYRRFWDYVSLSTHATWLTVSSTQAGDDIIKTMIFELASI